MTVLGIIVFIIICCMVGNHDSKKKQEQHKKEVRKIRGQMSRCYKKLIAQGYSDIEVIYSKEYTALNNKLFKLYK